MSNLEIDPDGELWQLLKAYANEDWNAVNEPWPAPAKAFLADASRVEAAALAAEIKSLMRKAPASADWSRLLSDAHVDVRKLSPDGELTAWADDLRRRAQAAAGRL